MVTLMDALVKFDIGGESHTFSRDWKNKKLKKIITIDQSPIFKYHIYDHF